MMVLSLRVVHGLRAILSGRTTNSPSCHSVGIFSAEPRW